MEREEIFIELGGGAPKTWICLLTQKLSFKFEFPLSSPRDGHDGWLADPRPLVSEEQGVPSSLDPSCGGMGMKSVT